MKRGILTAVYQQAAFSKAHSDPAQKWEDESELFRAIIRGGPGTFVQGNSKSQSINEGEADKVLGRLKETLESIDYFLTDLGSSQKLKDPGTGEVRMTIPRYGVWSPKGRKPYVVETSDDLEYLKSKYKVDEVTKIS